MGNAPISTAKAPDYYTGPTLQPFGMISQSA